jgi:type I restriction enzyme S subunit
MQSDLFMNRAVEISVGSLSPTINWKTLAIQEFALPPLEEQRRALNALSSFDASLEAFAEVSTARDAMIRAFIQERFEYFDEHCDHKPASELMRKITVGIVVKPADLYVSAGSGVLALRSLNVFPGRFVLDETVEISSSGHAEHQKSQLSTGDIVVVRTGRPGDAAVIGPDLDGVNCIDLIVAKPGDTVDSGYVATFLNSTFGRRIFSSGTTGTAQKHFNVGEFSKLKLPVPQLSVQRQFVAELMELRSSTESIEQRLASAKRVRWQLLEQVLGG